MIVTRIAPVSLAKILGCLYAIMGLIFGAILAVVTSLVGQFGPSEQAMPPFMSMMFGVGSIVFLPLFYGVLGFIGGVVSALVYNLAAKAMGGIEIDVQDSHGPMVTGR